MQLHFWFLPLVANMKTKSTKYTHQSKRTHLIYWNKGIQHKFKLNIYDFFSFLLFICEIIRFVLLTPTLFTFFYFNFCFLQFVQILVLSSLEEVNLSEFVQSSILFADACEMNHISHNGTKWRHGIICSLLPLIYICEVFGLLLWIWYDLKWYKELERNCFYKIESE